MKKTFVFMLAFVAMLTWLVFPLYAPYVFAGQNDAQAEEAELIEALNGFPGIVKEEVQSLVALLDQAGPIVGIGIELLPKQEDDKYWMAVVVAVIKGKPAEKAGLQKGDKILTVNGKPPGASADYDAFVAEIRGDGKAGRMVTFEIDRNGTKMTVPVVTAALRSDKTVEAKKMREAIEKESAAHIAAVKNAADAIVKGLERGSFDTKDLNSMNPTDPRLQAFDEARLNFSSWWVKKSQEIEKFLAVE